MLFSNIQIGLIHWKYKNYLIITKVFWKKKLMHKKLTLYMELLKNIESLNLKDFKN